MSGYPNIPTRQDFGPEMENVRPPVMPTRDLSAGQMNLSFWQTAGAGRTLPQALILFDGTIPGIVSQSLAFDPRQELGNITFVDNGVGDYTFTFASTYKDQRGADVAFAPLGAIAVPQNVAAGVEASPTLISGQDVTIEVVDAASAPLDAIILLQVWGG